MFCTPEWTRTTNLQLRRLLLYPIELRAQVSKITSNYKKTKNINFSFVGAARFELATSCSQSRRDNRTTLRPVYSFFTIFEEHSFKNKNNKYMV